MHTATADHILARMTEVQRIKIHQANEGSLEYIRQTTGGYGPISPELMQEIKIKVTAKYSEWDSTLSMVPSTWKW
jgi:hypothetical protein